MSQPFDATLKQLVDEFAADWVGWLAPTLHLPAGTRATPFPAELSTVQLLADRVFRLQPPELGLLHIEPQANWDGDLLQRLHEYNVLLHRHAEHVYTVLLLLRREANRPTFDGRLVRRFADGTESGGFRYFAVRVWELHADELLAGDIGTLPLALLTDDAEFRLGEVVDRIDARLQAERAREDTRKRVLTSGYFLMGLRYNEDQIQQAFVRARGMKESTTYQAVLREGRQEGLLEAKREDLLNILRTRFAALPSDLESRIAATTDVPTLTAAIRAAVTVASPDDIRL